MTRLMEEIQTVIVVVYSLTTIMIQIIFLFILLCVIIARKSILMALAIALYLMEKATPKDDSK